MKPRPPAWLLCLACFTLPIPALAAPVTFNTALPVAEGEFVGRIQGIGRHAGDDPAVANRDLRVRSLIGVLGYGIIHRLALFAVVPYVDKRLALDGAGGGKVHRGASGIGDASVFARGTLLQRDAPGRTLRVGVFGGVKAPIGNDDQSDALGRLPQPLQAGSGAWDVFGGVVVSMQSLAYEVDSQLGYRAHGTANGFEAGDELRWDASIQYRLWPRSLENRAPGFLYGVLETNLSWRDKNRSGGANDPDSGGLRLFLTPGIQYVMKRWVVESVVQLPVHQNLNGDALEEDYSVLFGIRFNF